MADHSTTPSKAEGSPRPPDQDPAHPAQEGHTSFIRTPRQLIIIVALSLLVPIFLIVLLANYVVHGTRTGAGTDAMSARAIESRISPVAKLEIRDADRMAAARSGEEVYKTVCMACHAAGVAGAPKLADKAAWAPRIATGLESLVTAALKGKGAMPAQGGGDYSDVEITKAVAYMANSAGANFEEPKAEGEAAKGEAGKGEAAKGEGRAPKAGSPAPNAQGGGDKKGSDAPGAQQGDAKK